LRSEAEAARSEQRQTLVSARAVRECDAVTASSHPVATGLAVVALAVLLAGCGAPQASSDSLAGTVGEVGGVAHNDSISVTAEDGFTEAELQRLVTRAMARVEYVRGIEFDRMVDVEVITRAEYRSRRSGSRWDGVAAEWQNQVWEGLFVVGEDRDVAAVYNQTFGSSVQGYYQPGREQIVIVSDGNTTTVDTGTLVHELVHALQDQRFGLDRWPDTRDGQMARNGLIEGEASLVPQLYFDRCGEEWACDRPETPPASSAGVDLGLFSVVIYPYDQGPSFVEQLREEGGWDAVDSAHDDQPASTEQVIHPEKYPDDEPDRVRVPDRSSDSWSRLDHEPVGERLGEAAIFTMFRTNGVIEPDAPRSYDHPASAGWGGDRLVPYTEEEPDLGQPGGRPRVPRPVRRATRERGRSRARRRQVPAPGGAVRGRVPRHARRAGGADRQRSVARRAGRRAPTPPRIVFSPWVRNLVAWSSR